MIDIRSLTYQIFQQAILSDHPDQREMSSSLSTDPGTKFLYFYNGFILRTFHEVLGDRDEMKTESSWIVQKIWLMKTLSISFFSSWG